MKKKNKLLIAGVIVLFIISSVLLIFNGVKVYQYSFTVGNSIGLNVDTDKIYFGTVPVGERSRRTLVIKNTNHKSVVRIKSFGDLSDHLYTSENNFVMEKDETKEINLFMITDQNTKYGKYAGNVVFLFTKI